MKAFADLFFDLEEATKTDHKVAALERYFQAAPPEDAAWAVQLLCGRRPKRLAPTRELRRWLCEATGIPDWMFEPCHGAVGDLGETMTLLVPPGPGSNRPLRHWLEERLLPLAGLDEERQKRELIRAWSELDERQLLVWNKLLIGGLRTGASRRQVVRALARVSGLDPATLAHRLPQARRPGAWEPTAEGFRRLLAADTSDADVARPFPFLRATALEGEPTALGEVGDWLAEWRWDGRRAQLVRRRGRTSLWSRRQELLAGRCEEIEEAAALLPEGTVVEGVIMAWRDGAPLPSAELERRLSRARAGPKLRREVPVVLRVHDLLEHGNEDVRGRDLFSRRETLAALLGELPPAVGERLQLSPAVAAESWEDLDRARREARRHGADGLMLKRLASPYDAGCGDWRHWPADPLRLDAVLMYAQRGRGRRAALYTDYTFGLWHEGELVPFAKAGSGLSEHEVRRVDAFVRRHAVERFGPVRAVEPTQVFEIAFDGVEPAPRRKSGLAVREPRIARWCTDERPEQAGRLEDARALLPPAEED